MAVSEEEKGALYIHAEAIYAQESKRANDVCGDLIIQEKSEEASVFALFDGIGSGIKANIAAHLNSARLMRMLKEGFSLREAGERIAASMHQAREGKTPFAAFAVARVLNDGSATILTYEMPPPVFIKQGAAYTGQQRFFLMGGEMVGESLFKLDENSGILFFSDGITQAGMGTVGKFSAGWGVKDAAAYTDMLLKDNVDAALIPALMVQEAKRLSGGTHGDDTTAVLITSRQGKTVHILTGPPCVKENDAAMVEAFMKAPGIKIICGSTTADIVARHTGILVKGGRGTGSFINPPRYFMNGIDIVTEGALSLNQLYNILDYDNKMYDRNSCVSEMAVLIKAVERVVFWVGKADNENYQDIVFPQLGLFPRKQIIPFIEDKLRKMGKLVIKKEF